jgi:hypothetical protein
VLLLVNLEAILVEDAVTHQRNATANRLKQLLYFGLDYFCLFQTLQKQKCICDKVERLKDNFIEH